jgi:hypothetical protein
MTFTLNFNLIGGNVMNTAEQAESHTEVQTDTDTTPFSAYSAAFSNLDLFVDRAEALFDTIQQWAEFEGCTMINMLSSLGVEL